MRPIIGAQQDGHYYLVRIRRTKRTTTVIRHPQGDIPGKMEVFTAKTESTTILNKFSSVVKFPQPADFQAFDAEEGIGIPEARRQQYAAESGTIDEETLEQAGLRGLPRSLAEFEAMPVRMPETARALAEADARQRHGKDQEAKHEEHETPLHAAFARVSEHFRSARLAVGTHQMKDLSEGLRDMAWSARTSLVRKMLACNRGSDGGDKPIVFVPKDIHPLLTKSAWPSSRWSTGLSTLATQPTQLLRSSDPINRTTLARLSALAEKETEIACTDTKGRHVTDITSTHAKRTLPYVWIQCQTPYTHRILGVKRVDQPPDSPSGVPPEPRFRALTAPELASSLGPSAVRRILDELSSSTSGSGSGSASGSGAGSASSSRSRSSNSIPAGFYQAAMTELERLQDAYFYAAGLPTIDIAGPALKVLPSVLKGSFAIQLPNTTRWVGRLKGPSGLDLSDPESLTRFPNFAGIALVKVSDREKQELRRNGYTSWIPEYWFDFNPDNPQSLYVAVCLEARFLLYQCTWQGKPLGEVYPNLPVLVDAIVTSASQLHLLSAAVLMGLFADRPAWIPASLLAAYAQHVGPVIKTHQARTTTGADAGSDTGASAPPAPPAQSAPSAPPAPSAARSDSASSSSCGGNDSTSTSDAHVDDCGDRSRSGNSGDGSAISSSGRSSGSSRSRDFPEWTRFLSLPPPQAAWIPLRNFVYGIGCYTVSSGPWRRCFVRPGYNPYGLFPLPLPVYVVTPVRPMRTDGILQPDELQPSPIAREKTDDDDADDDAAGSESKETKPRTDQQETTVLYCIFGTLPSAPLPVPAGVGLVGSVEPRKPTRTLAAEPTGNALPVPKAEALELPRVSGDELVFTATGEDSAALRTRFGIHQQHDEVLLQTIIVPRGSVLAIGQQEHTGVLKMADIWASIEKSRSQTEEGMSDGPVGGDGLTRSPSSGALSTSEDAMTTFSRLNLYRVTSSPHKESMHSLGYDVEGIFTASMLEETTYFEPSGDNGNHVAGGLPFAPLEALRRELGLSPSITRALMLLPLSVYANWRPGGEYALLSATRSAAHTQVFSIRVSSPAQRTRCATLIGTSWTSLVSLEKDKDDGSCIFQPVEIKVPSLRDLALADSSLVSSLPRALNSSKGIACHFKYGYYLSASFRVMVREFKSRVTGQVGMHQPVVATHRLLSPVHSEGLDALVTKLQADPKRVKKTTEDEQKRDDEPRQQQQHQ